MGFLNKMQVLGEIVAQRGRDATKVVQAQYQENGIRGVGAAITEAATDASAATKGYIKEVDKSNKRAANPIGITYKNGDPAKSVAQAAIAVINTTKKTIEDVRKKYESLEEKECEKNKM